MIDFLAISADVPFYPEILRFSVSVTDGLLLGFEPDFRLCLRIVFFFREMIDFFTFRINIPFYPDTFSIIKIIMYFR